MQSILTLEAIPAEYRSKGTVISIGNFDGVHRGHQALLQQVRKLATAQGCMAAAITFTPHPLRLLLGDTAPPSLLTDARKLRYLAEQNLDCTLLLPFTQKLAEQSPEDFIKQVLVDAFAIQHLAVGYDYAFGKGRRGNIELLRSQGQKYGFVVTQLDPLMQGGSIVSSTSIREAVQQGDVASAYKLLGHYYILEGSVIPGFQRGRKIGFPTANVQTDSFILRPKPGVYAVYAEIEGQERLFPAVANIGMNPTFAGTTLSVEAHILDFDADIYGKNIVLNFVQRLRDEQKFSGIEELVTRIQQDVQDARVIL